MLFCGLGDEDSRRDLDRFSLCERSSDKDSEGAPGIRDTRTVT